MAVAPSHFASAQSNSVTVTVNVGDLVLALLNNADNTAPAGITDSGGNLYGLIGTVTGAAFGYSALYVCINAAFSATSVSFTAGHSPSIAVGTFTGATGAGILTSANSTSGTSLSQAITTKVANSYVAAFYSFIKSGTTDSISAGTGTLQSSVSSTSAVNGAGVVSLVAATAGSFTPSVTAAATVTGYAILEVEVWSATYDSYFGKTPPRENVAVKFSLVPTFGGSGGGPVTPVPVAVVLHDGTNGTPYSETISAQGGAGGYTYAVTGGALPTGTSLNSSTGVISGTPTVNGTYSFTIKVTDSVGSVGSQSFSITVSAAASGGGAFTFLN